VRLLIAAVLALTTAGCLHAKVPSADRMARDVAALQSVFPTLQALEVHGFRDQDSCRFIEYPRGAFTNILDAGSTCNLFHGKPQAFDATATADFDTVKQALDESGVRTMIVWNIEYDNATGAIKRAEFDLEAGLYDRFSYLYEPNSSDAPNPDTIVLTQVNPEWWFSSEDWN
jgi:hypothetical protein